MAHDFLGRILGVHEADELADFIACGAFRPDLQPYEHQRRAFEQSVVQGRDVVITTGTGSGKTECFLLPLIARARARIADVGRAWRSQPRLGLVESFHDDRRPPKLALTRFHSVPTKIHPRAPPPFARVVALPAQCSG